MRMGMAVMKKPGKEPLFPLRINHYTVVLVTADKCNENYANKLRTKYKNSVGKTSLKDITL